MKKNKLNVLISAYFCDPTKGSEHAVGWNFSKNMAQHHNIWVLTKKTNQKSIEKFVSLNPCANLFFIYYDFPEKWFFKEDILGEQISYIIWQLLVSKTYKRAEKIINFDIIHHLTFNQYRSPSIGYFTKKPFIIGPIGGAETVDEVFFQDLKRSTKIKERFRNSGLDIFLLEIASKIRSNAKTFVFSSKKTSLRLKNNLGKTTQTVNIPAIAIDKADFIDHVKEDELDLAKPFTIIYAGIALDWKGILLLLRAARSAFSNNDNVIIKMIGIRNEAENKEVSGWIQEHNLGEIVQLINFIPREQLIKEMSTADLSVYPAFRDSGSMSILEACALNCAVLCFDAGGQDVFPDDIIIKIPVSSVSYQTNVENFASKLKWALGNRIKLNERATKARNYVFENFTWENKVGIFCDLYTEVLLRNDLKEAPKEAFQKA